MSIKIITLETSPQYRTHDDEVQYVDIIAVEENGQVTYKISTFRNGTLMSVGRPSNIVTASNIFEDTETSLINQAAKHMERRNARA
jgi:hypothetical protein